MYLYGVLFLGFYRGLQGFQRWVFVYERMEEEGKYIVLFDFILNLENQDKKMRISFGICAKSTKEK